mmetsp:Transcript_39554/g.51818  ORF Transcript_39554/g.51818 Transcript_39554/m.51818 type:complete len:203 (-) Transcript_39554:316-924(-)
MTNKMSKMLSRLSLCQKRLSGLTKKTSRRLKRLFLFTTSFMCKLRWSTTHWRTRWACSSSLVAMDSPKWRARTPPAGSSAPDAATTTSSRSKSSKSLKKPKMRKRTSNLRNETQQRKQRSCEGRLSRIVRPLAKSLRCVRVRRRASLGPIGPLSCANLEIPAYALVKRTQCATSRKTRYLQPRSPRSPPNFFPQRQFSSSFS